MAHGLSFVSKHRVAHRLSQRSQRSILLLVVVTVLISACGLRLVQLQILQGSSHRQRAEQNRIALVPMPADRGNLLDRKGRLLAANRLSRTVYLRPREQTEQQWAATVPRLAKILHIPQDEILAKLQQSGYRAAMPVRVTRNLSREAFILLAEQSAQMPGVEVRAESSRYYPNGRLAAHIIGYIGEASRNELKNNPQYPMGMMVGQMGLERLANEMLQGQWGGQILEVNASGQEVGVLGMKPPVSGTAITLTVDVDLQRAAEQTLGGRRGAVVVLDVKTGAILVLASSPTFDPNLFTRRISQTEWEELQRQDDPFLNRALQGYPPGSTFKIVTTAAGIQSGKFSTDSALMTFPALNLGGHLFHEHGSGYGVIGFRQALAVSSNTFFYQVGLATGPEQIAKWGQRLGVGPITNLGLDGGSHGMIPTPQEKEKLFGEPWYGGDTVSMSIGQGLVQMTPLEMAVMTAAIANGGWRVKPHLLSDQTHTQAKQPEKTGLDSGTIAVIRDGLTGVVQYGTASQLNDGSIPLTAGKTGTAEVKGQRDNAVYVGFGPVENPQIAVAVVVENGGYGAESAVPIAHQIYRTYFRTPRQRSK